MEELAQVYARALFQVAIEHDKLDLLHEQLGEVADAFDSNRDLGLFFFSPNFSVAEKKEGLNKLISGADPALGNFLELLIEKHRTPAIFRVRRDFDALWREENKLLSVQITSAVELDKAVVDKIGARIGEQTGRKVELSAGVDPDIIGGIVLRVGNSILDASIRNRLEQLRKNVAAA